MISIVFRNSTSGKKYSSKFFKKILETAIRKLKLNKNFSVSVNLVGEKKIKELNKKYRNKNKPTDVLSFPINDHVVGSRQSSVVSCDLGDIFICLSIAKKETKRENVSIKRKLAQLVVHGFLHLLGCDHEKSKKEAESMFKLEEKILKTTD